MRKCSRMGPRARAGASRHAHDQHGAGEDDGKGHARHEEDPPRWAPAVAARAPRQGQGRHDDEEQRPIHILHAKAAALYWGCWRWSPAKADPLLPAADE